MVMGCPSFTLFWPWMMIVSHAPVNVYVPPLPAIDANGFCAQS